MFQPYLISLHFLTIRNILYILCIYFSLLNINTHTVFILVHDMLRNKEKKTLIYSDNMLHLFTKI